MTDCPNLYEKPEDVNPLICSACEKRFNRNHMKDGSKTCQLYEDAYYVQNSGCTSEKVKDEADQILEAEPLREVND